MELVDFIAYFLVFIKGLLIFVAIAFFISGLDEFFIDMSYAVREVYRDWFIRPKYQPLTEERLLEPPEQLMAIMIPAWDEAGVIDKMLGYTLKTLKYANYHIFVGTYPNDPATQREVEQVAERHGNVHLIICSEEGPTSKADCLNCIFQGIKDYEKEHNIQFAAFILDDAEDVVHPLSLKFFNYLIPRKDMIQLVVLPMEVNWHQFTGGHYMDEFAEMHYKNMVAREFLAHSVPSAGVGCAFSRRAVDRLAGRQNNQLFKIDTLTEDYEIGVNLKALGLKGIFAKHAVQRVVTRSRLFSGKPKKVKIREFIAIREHFPMTFWSAVRQKSRWIMGICLQGWAHLGWKGSLWEKYMYFRDRKGLITNCVNMLGYVVVFVILAYLLYLWLAPEPYYYHPLVERGTWLWYLILVDTFFMFFRLYERGLCVYRYYGLRQALLSVPRFFWGNILNFVASVRGTYRYFKMRATGREMIWDKTRHLFPSEEKLQAIRHGQFGR
jgi:adsorption protein B